MSPAPPTLSIPCSLGVVPWVRQSQFQTSHSPMLVLVLQSMLPDSVDSPAADPENSGYKAVASHVGGDLNLFPCAPPCS